MKSWARAGLMGPWARPWGQARPPPIPPTGWVFVFGFPRPQRALLARDKGPIKGLIYAIFRDIWLKKLANHEI